SIPPISNCYCWHNFSSKAMDWGHIQQNPAKRVRLSKEPPGGLHCLEAEEIESYHSALRPVRIEGFRFHDLRHIFASHLAMCGVALEVIGRLLGPKDPNMTKRYAQLSPTTLQQAVTTLQDLQVGTRREHGQKREQV